MAYKVLHRPSLEPNNCQYILRPALKSMKKRHFPTVCFVKFIKCSVEHV